MSRSFLYVFTIGAMGILMSACSPMNSEFSCNATAGDSCMTIEQVDEMTRFANEGRAKQGASREKYHQYSRASNEQSPQNEQALVWVAPTHKASEVAFKTRNSSLMNVHG